MLPKEDKKADQKDQLEKGKKVRSKVLEDKDKMKIKQKVPERKTETRPRRKFSKRKLEEGPVRNL